MVMVQVMALDIIYQFMNVSHFQSEISFLWYKKSLLSILKAPPSISYGSNSIYDERYVAGMIASDEPGYYLENEFGIRLETDIESVITPTKVK